MQGRYSVLRGMIMVINVVFFSGIAFFSNHLIKERHDFLQQLSNQMSESYAKQVLFQFDHIIDDMDHLLRGLSLYLGTEPQLYMPFDKHIWSILQEQVDKHPYLIDLLVTDMQGKIIQESGDGNPPDISDRPYITYHFAPGAKDLFVGTPKISRLNKDDYFFAVSRPVYENRTHEKIGVVSALVRIEYMENILDTMQQKGLKATIVTNDGIIYASNEFSRASGKMYESLSGFDLQSIANISNERTTMMNTKDQKMYVQYLTVPNAKINVVVTQEHQDIFGFLDTDRENVRILLIISGLFLTLFVWYILRQLRRIEAQNQQIKHNEKRLEVMAKRDHLTGMYNRRAFFERASSSYKTANQDSLSMAVILLDIDHFKRINDSFGHGEGDRILHEVASVLREMTREHDTAARYGGEEFVVLLENSDEAQAFEIAERIRKRIKEEVKDQAGKGITLSIGISILRDENGLDEVIQKADKAMYEAKANGRDQTAVYAIS